MRPYRWPLLVASTGRDGTFRLRMTLLVTGALLLLAVAPTLPGLPLAVRLFFGVLAVVALAFAAARRRSNLREAGAAVVADAVGLSRVSADGTKPLVGWNTPFGVTLLASYGRPLGLLAFTTPTQTRYVPARIDARSDADDELFARIAVLADLDLVDAITHDAALTANDTAALIRHAEGRARESLGRVYLSDSRGAPISLDRATLSIASRSFDLTSHLEWRALMFYESIGKTAALYQATWIRQNGAEVVLVAPMPASIVPREPNGHREATSRLGRTLTRDLRLLQSPAEPPPPREGRVAIDRPFMMAVRRALEQAPLASRVAPPSQRDQAATRDSIV